MDELAKSVAPSKLAFAAAAPEDSLRPLTTKYVDCRIVVAVVVSRGCSASVAQGGGGGMMRLECFGLWT